MEVCPFSLICTTLKTSKDKEYNNTQKFVDFFLSHLEGLSIELPSEGLLGRGEIQSNRYGKIFSTGFHYGIFKIFKITFF